MAAAVATMQAFITMFADGNASSIRALTVMTILILTGLSVYLGLLRLCGVVRIDEILSKDRPEP
jgi:hypothetical protein